MKRMLRAFDAWCARVLTDERVTAFFTLFALKNIAFGNWKSAAIEGFVAVLFGTSLPNPIPRWFSHSHD